jgi:hypothetical protein
MTIEEVLEIAAPGFDPQAFRDEDRNGDKQALHQDHPQ